MYKNRIVFFIFTCLIVIFSWLLYNYTQTNFHTVLANKVFRSAQLSTEVLTEKITEHHIATVVNLRGPNPSESWYIEEKQATEALNVKHIDIKYSSSGLNRVNRIKKLIDTYLEQAKPILFHCNGGADRASLASIIVLLLDGIVSLEEIRKQFSWRYLVINSDSAGKLFLENYSLWLTNNSMTHKPDVFIYWVDNYYQDDNDNMLFQITKINNKRLSTSEKTIQTITASRADKTLVNIFGVIMFYSGREKPTAVEVLLNQKPSTKMLTFKIRYRQKKHFDYAGFYYVDWVATQNTATLEDGCYDIQLKLTRNTSQSWTSPTRARLCIS